MLCGPGRDEAYPHETIWFPPNDLVGPRTSASSVELFTLALGRQRVRHLSMLLPFECLQFFQSAGPLRAEQPR
jgi:hypothetical protein